MELYQIFRREQPSGWAHSTFNPLHGIYLKVENAQSAMAKLKEGYKSFRFNEVIDEDADGNQIKEYVDYPIDECYRITVIIPIDAEKSDLPF